MKKIISFLICTVLAFLSCVSAYAGTATTLNVSASSASHEVSPLLYGISVDDNAFAVDGGLNADMVNNGSFEYAPNGEYAWQYSSDISMLSTQSPMNKNNQTYDRLTVEKSAVLINLGYPDIYDDKGEFSSDNLKQKSMYFKKDAVYVFTCFLKNEDFDGNVGVYLDSKSNNHDIVQLDLSSLSADRWTRITAKITSSSDEQGALGIKFTGNGSICIDSVSLVDETSYGYGEDLWKYSYLRTDLVQTIKNLKPAFIRFPGTCLAESDGSGNLYNWKDTIGSLEERKQSVNIYNRYDLGYGYNNSNAVGYHEYFQLCADLNAEPVPEVSAGVACQNNTEYEAYTQALNKTYMTDEQWQAYLINECGYKKSEVASRTAYIDSLGIKSREDFDEYMNSFSLTPGTKEFTNYAQDVLDLIEYANGDARITYWGSQRMKNGSEAPFEMKYIQIGGDGYGEIYRRNFEALKSIINEKYPDIKVIASSSPNASGEDFERAKAQFSSDSGIMLFENNYSFKDKPLYMTLNRYDSYARNGSQVIARYRSSLREEKSIVKSSNIINACDNAVFMLGAEKNSDIVTMSTYQTTFAKLNNGGDGALVYFNLSDIVLTPDYYTQMIFANNVGTKTLSSDLVSDSDKLFHSVTYDENSKSLFIKLVNISGNKEKVSVNLNGFDDITNVSVQSVENEAKTAHNTADKQYVTCKQSDVEYTSGSFDVSLKPYSNTVVRVACGDNLGSGFFTLPDTINTEVKSYIPMSAKLFIIMMVAIFVLATVVTYLVYSKVVLKGKKPDFKKKKKDDK